MLQICSPSSRLSGVLGIWTRHFTSNHSQTQRATRTYFQSFYKVTKNPASTTWGGFTLHLPANLQGGGYKTNQAHERASTSTHKRLRPMHEPREEQARKKHRRLFFLSAPLRQPSQHSACGACAKLVYLGYGRERNLRRACPTHVQYSRGGDVEYHSAPLRG